MAGMGWDFSRDVPEELASEIDGCGNRRSRGCNESRDAETTQPADSNLRMQDGQRLSHFPKPALMWRMLRLTKIAQYTRSAAFCGGGIGQGSFMDLFAPHSD